MARESKPLKVYWQGPDDPEPSEEDVPKRYRRGYPEKYHWIRQHEGLHLPSDLIDHVLDQLNINRQRRWELRPRK